MADARQKTSTNQAMRGLYRHPTQTYDPTRGTTDESMVSLDSGSTSNDLAYSFKNTMIVQAAHDFNKKQMLMVVPHDSES